MESAIVESTLKWLDDVLYKLAELLQRDKPIDELNLMTSFVVNKIVVSSFSHLSDSLLCESDENYKQIESKRI